MNFSFTFSTSVTCRDISEIVCKLSSWNNDCNRKLSYSLITKCRTHTYEAYLFSKLTYLLQTDGNFCTRTIFILTCSCVNLCIECDKKNKKKSTCNDSVKLTNN